MAAVPGLVVASALTLAAALLVAAPAWAFDPRGHDIIEAAAYRRLLATSEVPGTGVSGKTLLATLAAQKVLEPPPCLGAPPLGGCSPEALQAAPLRGWPPLGSGAADLLIDRQLDERGQCQHFMAKTADGMTPVDPRLGVPGALATTAYQRCLAILGVVLDNILRHPRLASWRVAGMYVLMHALEDSFSPAHAHRDGDGGIVHLLSWKLIDWPFYLWHGQLHFPAETHHAITDPRDATYLIADGTVDGRPCTSFHQAYAVPEACLSANARAAVAAVSDLLVMTYTLRRQAAAKGQVASLRSFAGQAAWGDFVGAHLRSTSAARVAPAQPIEAPPRPDVFVGVLGSLQRGGWGGGLWGGRLFYGPALPFALGAFAGAGFSRDASGHNLVGSLALSLYLPILRRYVVGFSPAILQVKCATGFDHCSADGQATLGNLIVRLGPVWLSLQGPVWSWDERQFHDAHFAAAIGWWHERRPREAAPGATGDAALTWHPPDAAQVETYRLHRTTSLAYLAATAASTARDQTVGAGLETWLDRDTWNRRAGLAPGASVGYAFGTVDGVDTGVITAAALVRLYLLPDALALVLSPAALGLRTSSGPGGAIDLQARAGLALMLGRIELRADAPPLSYLDSNGFHFTWHRRPFSIGLALLLR